MGSDGGSWLAAIVLTAVAVAGGVILAGYIGGYLQSKQSSG